MTTRSSHISSLGSCGVRAMLLVTPLLLASSAYAERISIALQESGVHGGHIHQVDSGHGNVSVAGLSYGTFTINDISAQDFSVLGKPGLLNSQSLDISSSTAGVLTVYVTAQGLSFTGAQKFASSFAVNDLSGSIVSVDESTYFSPTDSKFDSGQTLLNKAMFNSIGTSGPFITSGVLSGIYSVTEEFQIFDTGGGPGNDNITIDLSGTSASVVPEPGSLLLMGTGLLGLAGILFRRARKPNLTLPL